MTEAKTEAVQAAVDRVTDWQQTATEDTVIDELRRTLDEAGVQLDDTQIEALSDAIRADDGPVDAAKVLA